VDNNQNHKRWEVFRLHTTLYRVIYRTILTLKSLVPCDLHKTELNVPERDHVDYSPIRDAFRFDGDEGVRRFGRLCNRKR